MRALQAFLTSRIAMDAGGSDIENLRRFRALVADTPSLSAYLSRTWARHTDALAGAISGELGLASTPPVVRALAYLVVQAPVAARGTDVDPREQLDACFALLRTGWDAQQRTLSGDPDG